MVKNHGKWSRIYDHDRIRQNLIDWSLGDGLPLQKLSSKSVLNFWRYIANKKWLHIAYWQTDRHTHSITSSAALLLQVADNNKNFKKWKQWTWKIQNNRYFQWWSWITQMTLNDLEHHRSHEVRRYRRRHYVFGCLSVNASVRPSVHPGMRPEKFLSTMSYKPVDGILAERWSKM